jgi:hypothetical protein
VARSHKYDRVDPESIVYDQSMPENDQVILY